MATNASKISVVKPLVLSGGPRRVCGTLELLNEGTEEIFLSAIPVHESDLKDPSGNMIRDLPVMRNLPPGGRVSVPVRLLLDRATPPGEYQTSLALESSDCSLLVQVSEQVALKALPREIFLQGGPKAILQQRITIQNLSNVPLSIGKLGGIILDEEDSLCRSLQASLRAKGKEGFQAVLDSLAAEFASTRVDLVRVGIEEKKVQISPAGSRELTLKFHLPKDLKPGRTYSGLLRIHSASINIQLLVTNDSDDDSSS